MPDTLGPAIEQDRRVTRLVERWGRFGFAALTSVAWLLPCAAWAGSFDLGPHPGTGPWVALALGLALLAAWLALVVWIQRVAVPPRRHRFDVGQMSAPERWWSLGFFASSLVVLAWLNAAATVDWTLIRPSRAAVLLVVVLVAILVAAVAAAAVCWRQAALAYSRRP